MKENLEAYLEHIRQLVLQHSSKTDRDPDTDSDPDSDDRNDSRNVT